MFVPDTLSRPPLGLSIPQTEQLILTILTHVPYFYLLYIGVHLQARGDSTPLLFAIGGLVSCVFEPIIDVMGFCYFPREGSWIAYEWHGRPIPWFVPATYGWFIGGQGYWFLTIMRDPATTKGDVWRLWLKSFTANIILEYPATFLKIYVYYGYQPLQVAGLPLWFFAIHAIAPMLSASVVRLLEKELIGFKKLAIPMIVVCTYGMANGGFGWPVWVTLSIDQSYYHTYPAAFVEGVLIATTIWIITLPFPELPATKGVRSVKAKVR